MEYADSHGSDSLCIFSEVAHFINDSGSEDCSRKYGDSEQTARIIKLIYVCAVRARRKAHFHVTRTMLRT